MTDAAARCITDPREPSTITHSIRDILRQRVYGLVQGWEDLNNHSQLCHDIAYQTAVGREDDLKLCPAGTVRFLEVPPFSDSTKKLKFAELRSNSLLTHRFPISVDRITFQHAILACFVLHHF
ncbi:MAG: transposase [Rhodocyclaceae bacterium]|nr:transposase [Rhodocyclaceae bacterium]MCA3030447.1 transposase [Rhodocyclaceae bacterium]MCA3036943.1 transposase [Rhodocyclaceae bacterium]MCA3046217.1 transposase [Rhodocyclaceae bacterium]MCA3048883.1 transposase [Rhodocyclaceae bacterium]